MPGGGVNQPLDLGADRVKSVRALCDFPISLLLTFISAKERHRDYCPGTEEGDLEQPTRDADDGKRAILQSVLLAGRFGGYGSRNRFPGSSVDDCSYSREPSIRSGISSRC